GAALARMATGHGGAAAVTTAALQGEHWATSLLDLTIAPLALALRRLHLELDPDSIIIGGGLGLAPGYLDRLESHLAPLSALMRPRIRAAALGADAGLIGIADLAITAAPEGEA
ncbi:ROK family protein, partial [Lichenifustis flavocetrariae]